MSLSKYLIAVCSILLCSVAQASGTVAVSGGFIGGAGSIESGSREWVDLNRVGALHIGYPINSPIKMITVFAPGVERAYVIIRNVQKSNDEQSFQITAPERFRQKIVRATIYIDEPEANTMLFNFVDGDWKAQFPQGIEVTAGTVEGAYKTNLVAFQINRLGSFSLVQGERPAPGYTSDENGGQSARALFGGTVQHALMPATMAILLLAVGWVTSRWVFNLGGRSDD